MLAAPTLPVAHAGDHDDNGVIVRHSFRALVNPTERQLEFWHEIDSGGKFIFYGGARGGGKSYILRWTAVRVLIRWHQRLKTQYRAQFLDEGHPAEIAESLAYEKSKGIRVGIFCETFPALQDRQISRVVREFPEWLGRWNGGAKEFVLHQQYGGGVICFRNLDDPKKYLSAEFAAAFVDELTRNSLDVFNDLRGSIRWPGIEDCFFCGASNPGGPGHAWVKDIWIGPNRFSMEETRTLVDPVDDDEEPSFTRADFRYVKSLATDNPHNPKAYIRMLRSLPPKLRAAYLDGNWDHFDGMAFPEWDSRYHVVRGYRPPPGTFYVAGLDWGYNKLAYVLCAVYAEGDIEVVWEFYQGNLHAYDAARAILERSVNFPLPMWIAYDTQMDSDAGVKAGMRLIDEFRRGMLEHFGKENAGELPIRLIGATKGKGSRVIKKNVMHTYLAAGKAFVLDADGKETDVLQPWARPRLRFHRRAQHSIRTIPALPLDPDKPEDVDTDAEDHLYDAVCNVLVSRPPLPEREEHAIEPDRHPGIDVKAKKRKKRFRKPFVDEETQPESTAGWMPDYSLGTGELVPASED